MSHLATENSDDNHDDIRCSLMFTYVHLCSLCTLDSTGHLQPQELSSRVSGLSGAHQRVSTLQRLKPDVLKTRNMTCKHIEGFEIPSIIVYTFQETEARTVLTIP